MRRRLREADASARRFPRSRVGLSRAALAGKETGTRTEVMPYLTESLAAGLLKLCPRAGTCAIPCYLAHRPKKNKYGEGGEIGMDTGKPSDAGRPAGSVLGLMGAELSRITLSRPHDSSCDFSRPGAGP